jgi:GalNAc5-diNAcBac-PP-undecaprenol beta-1,3-glucosyltransferase
MNANPPVDVIIPTHNHGPTISFAVQSVLAQTFQNFRIVIVGDGVSSEHETLISRLCLRDSRIRFVSNPKGAGLGESHRAKALAESQASFVCYLGDDDLWLPHHLETLLSLLDSNDFVHTLHTDVATDGAISATAGKLDDLETQRRMRLMWCRWNYFGPTCVGHRMDAYRRLPFGWRPRPDGMTSDLYMWRQWLDLPGCRFYSHPYSTTLHFPSPLREGMSLEERCRELDYWGGRVAEEGFPTWLLEAVLKDWQRRFLAPAPAAPPPDPAPRLPTWQGKVPGPIRKLLSPTLRLIRKIIA